VTFGNDSKKPASFAFWGLCVFVVLVFLTGGSARPDVQSLPATRPLAIVFFGSAVSLSLDNLHKDRTILLLGAVILVATILYVLPVPGYYWSGLAGRELILTIDNHIFREPLARPIAIDNNAAWNTTFSIFVPATCILLMTQVNRGERFAILPILIGLGLLSGVLGLLQSISDPQGPLYFYQITNNGSSVGAFANRNHHAILLSMLFPMLAVYASAKIDSSEQARRRGWFAVVAGAFLVPLILVTGSRAGLFAGLLAIIAAVMLYQPQNGNMRMRGRKTIVKWRWPIIGIVAVGLAFTTLALSRAEALLRVFAPEQGVFQARTVVWQPTMTLISHYFPVGAGPGSFVRSYAAHEPDELLAFTYLNHAHNDWLEFVLSFGVLAFLLIAIGAVALGKTIWRLRACNNVNDRALAGLGLIILAIVAGGSVVDYPLRTPLIGVFVAVAITWCVPPSRSSSKNDLLHEKE
jgi:O-antigen ligase